MMALTLSGWSAIPTRDNPALTTVPIPGTKSKIVTTKFLAPLWVCVLIDINAHIIPIDGGYGPDCWSYRAPRLGYSCVELPSARRYPEGKVPSKISSIRGHLALLEVLIRACLGGYDPR